MKAKPYQVNALVPKIQKEFKGALVFGPDFGIVQEISEKIAHFIVSDFQDAFRVIKLTPSKIKEIPSILIDEGNAQTLLGGRKLLWVKDADNTVTEAVDYYLKHIQSDTFLLLSAGNLMKNSSLRQLGETEKEILAIACYEEEAKDVALFIQEILGQSGIRVNSKAMSFLLERLGENRLATRRELEKLISYLGPQKTVEIEDVLAVITDTQNASTDAFCCAVATGDHERAEKEYHLMIENGENPVGIIRILYNYFNRLLDAASVIESGDSVGALKKIMKPAQFRLENSFKKQLKIWKKSFILKVLNLLIEAEQQSKQTGLPAELLLDRIIIQIASVAKRYEM